MSSYQFDKEALDEIEFWQDRTKMLEIDVEVLQAEIYELETIIRDTENIVDNLIVLNELQAPLSEIDIYLDDAKEFLNKRKVKDA